MGRSTPTGGGNYNDWVQFGEFEPLVMFRRVRDGGMKDLGNGDTQIVIADSYICTGRDKGKLTVGEEIAGKGMVNELMRIDDGDDLACRVGVGTRGNRDYPRIEKITKSEEAEIDEIFPPGDEDDVWADLKRKAKRDRDEDDDRDDDRRSSRSRRSRDDEDDDRDDRRSRRSRRDDDEDDDDRRSSRSRRSRDDEDDDRDDRRSRRSRDDDEDDDRRPSRDRDDDRRSRRDRDRDEDDDRRSSRSRRDRDEDDDRDEDRGRGRKRPW